MARQLMAAAVLTGSLFVGQVAPAIPLVREGEPAAVIVLSQTPSPVAYEAATELQRVIQRISGVTLPIYLEGEWWPGEEGPRRFTTQILVGDSDTAQRAGLDLSTVGPEGYVIKTVPAFYPAGESAPHNYHPVIILAGREERKTGPAWGWRAGRKDRQTRGTAYAVYAFLSEDLGVRWLWPGELGEVVPHMETIEVSPPDRTGAPKLAQRLFRNLRYMAGHYYATPEKVGMPHEVWTRMEHGSQWWMDHLRLGDTGEIAMPSKEGMGAEFAEQYAETHPEYFALQPDGTRLASEFHGRVRLCLSNPEVIRLVAQGAIDYFDQNPQGRVYGIELADTYGSYCVCDECQAWGPTLSDLVARHWAAVAELVAEAHPDRLLYAHPYSLYIDSPTEVTRIPDNILLAPVGWGLIYFPDHPAWRGAGDTAAAIRERSLTSFVGWAKLNNQNMIWRPNYPHHRFAGPLNYSRAVAEDIKVMYEHGLRYVDIDWMVNRWAGEGLNFYIVCKLLWDPQLDYDALVDDYCEKGFGPAASAVRAYFDALEEVYDQFATEATNYVRIVDYYPPAVTGRLHRLLDKARAAAQGDETVVERIAFLRSAVEYAQIEYRAAQIRAALQEKTEAGQLPSDEEIEAAQNMIRDRQAFLRRFIGRWELEPEEAWGDWMDDVATVLAPAEQ